MTYKDELTIRLQQAGIEPTDELLRFIDIETIWLKSELFIKRGGIMEYDELRKWFNKDANIDNIVGYFESNGWKVINPDKPPKLELSGYHGC